MHYYMPQFCYHERTSLLSVDVHPQIQGGAYRMVTSSVQHNIAIWEFEFKDEETAVPSIGLCFIASLEGHNTTVTQVRFSPTENNILASGDVYGRIFIWRLSDQPGTVRPAEGYPPNREKWIRIKALYHDSDVTSMCWKPGGKHLASVSGDSTLRVHDALTGRNIFTVSNLRYFPNGVTYDTKGKYIVTMSTDRKMDLICAEKGTKLRHFGAFEMPNCSIGGVEFKKKEYQMFHDDVFTSYTRVCAFSPCGQLLVVPAGRLQTPSGGNFYCSYVYKRSELNRDRPAAVLHSPRNPTFIISFCPTIFELVKDSPNYSGLPYRLIWVALSQEEIIFYDSQHPNPIALCRDLTYKYLSDVTWSKDGKIVVVSDTEEYCHYIRFDIDELGKQINTLPTLPDSPNLKKKKTSPKVAVKDIVKKPRSPKKKKIKSALIQLQEIVKPVLPSWDGTSVSKIGLSKIFTPTKTNDEQSKEDSIIFDGVVCCSHKTEETNIINQADNGIQEVGQTTHCSLIQRILPKRDNHYLALPARQAKASVTPKKRLSIITLE